MSSTSINYRRPAFWRVPRNFNTDEEDERPGSSNSVGKRVHFIDEKEVRKCSVHSFSI